LPIKREDMSHEERKRITVLNVSEGSIWARGCADGSSQRKYTTNPDPSFQQYD